MASASIAGLPMSAASLRLAREHGHDDERYAGDDDSEEAVLGRLSPEQIDGRFVADIQSQGKEADGHNPERNPFDLLAVSFVGVGIDAPEQRGAGGDFDEAIHTKCDQRNAAGEYAREHGNKAFEAVPDDGEIFELLAAANEVRAVECQFGHVVSVSDRGCSSAARIVE